MNARAVASELPASLQWINSGERLSLDALRGRVILLHFWSYDCVHSNNTLPDLRYLEQKYHDGLTVIGVHTPKYDHQCVAAPVLKAVNRHHIRHAVANDPEYRVWRDYGVQSWPTMAVIDAQGQLAALLPGESRRQEADALIARLLDDAAGRDLRVFESNIATLRPEPRLPLSFPGKLLATPTSLWIADSGHNRILECNHEGRILRQFGSGTPAYLDGRKQEAGFNDPQGMAIYKDALLVADRGNHAVRRIRLLSGDVDTLVGTGVVGRDVPDEQPNATRLGMSAPTDIAVLNDKVYIAVSGQHQIWQVDMLAKRVSVLAGTGQLGIDDGDAVAATFAQPSSLSIYGQQLVIADAASSAIRMLRLFDNQVSTLIGSGLYEFGDAAGKRDTARLQNPLAVCVDARGLAFVADTYNDKIKALNLRTGELRALNLRHQFAELAGLSLAAGALWIANTNAHEILRADLQTGQIKRLVLSD